MKPRRAPVGVWSATPAGQAAYRTCRTEAQAAANADGFDRGLERNDIFKTFRFFMLPKRENRRGHELACEVVSCENLAKCQPGHGPNVGPLAGPNADLQRDQNLAEALDDGRPTCSCVDKDERCWRGWCPL